MRPLAQTALAATQTGHIAIGAGGGFGRFGESGRHGFVPFFVTDELDLGCC